MSWFTFGYNKMPCWVDECERCHRRLPRELLRWVGLEKLCPVCAGECKVVIVREKE